MKKLFFLLIFAIFFIISMTFAAFNTEAVMVNFYFISISLPLSVLMMISVLTGIIIGACMIYLGALKLRYENKRLTQRLTANDKKLQELNNIAITEAKTN